MHTCTYTLCKCMYVCLHSALKQCRISSYDIKSPFLTRFRTAICVVEFTIHVYKLIIISTINECQDYKYLQGYVL